MDISYLGMASVRLKGKDTVIITDPFAKTGTLSLGKQTADVVTISHLSAGASFIEGIQGEPRVVDRPGEYEVAGVSIIGLANQTIDGLRNTIYVIDIDELSICHLGAIGVVPTPEQMQQLATSQVVIAPVGGTSTLPIEQIVEIVNQIEPRMVIPVGYRDAMSGVAALPIEDFLKTMGLKETEPRARLQLTRSTLPAEPQVALLTR